MCFTFHYASTYTEEVPEKEEPLFSLHSTMLLLIRTHHQFFCPVILTLHSTMLLLILIKKNVILLLKKLYIPLCFYLYDSQKFFTGIFILFTFHYASTYTDVE